MFDKEQLDQLYRYSLSLTGDESSAYDLLQTGLEKYLKNARSATKPIENRRGYMFRILRNTYIDQLRREKGRSFAPFEEVLDQSANVLSSGFQPLEDLLIERELVNSLMARLSGAERELLYLWAVESYTVQEIAQLMEVPRGTLLSRLYRIRGKLKDFLHQDEGTERKEAFG